MKQLRFIIPMLAVSFIVASAALLSNPIFGAAQQEIDYEQWGNIAVQTVQQAYPDREIVEYEYVGREEIDTNQAQDTFQLILREDDQEEEITVRIVFNTETEQLISVEIGEAAE